MTSANISAGTTTTFGELMRYWRRVRSVSQLQLALEADVSSRHVSFMETGRSQPSRQMVVQIAEALEVPLRERNTLLQSAGFAPQYRESALDSEELASVRQSLEFLLERHNPYPAVVVDRHWNVVLQNRASLQLLPRFVETPAALVAPVNVMRLLFRNDGIRPFVVNWEELSSAMIQRLHRESAFDPGDAEAAALLAEVLSAVGRSGDSRLPNLIGENPVTAELRLRRGNLEVGLFSAITTLGTPFDITLQELRMETFFPVDTASEKAVRSLFEGDDDTG